MPELQPADAFDVLADETRVRILQALGSAGNGAEPRSYSDLMDAVGVRDSGRFNYHLTRLCDHFVTRGPDGYSLSYEGVLVYRSIVAGTFSRHPPAETFETGSRCHECGDRLVVRSDEHVLHVTCVDCETTFLAGYLPPRGYADRSEREVIDALDRRVRYQIGLITHGVCPWCAGTVNAGLVPASESPLRDRPLETAVRHACHQCEARGWTTVGQRLLDHPAVVSFHDRHGVAITDRPVWELAFAVTDRDTTVRDRCPRRVELTLEREGKRLRVTVDDRADVVDVSRPSRDEGTTA
jgi:hypothetical protein